MSVEDLEYLHRAEFDPVDLGDIREEILDKEITDLFRRETEPRWRTAARKPGP